MADHVRPLPPPLPPATEPEPAPTVRLHHPVALFAVAAGLAIAAAIVVGGAIGALVVSASSSECSPSDGWCGLGAALLGLAAGVLSGGIAYIVTGVMTIFRCRTSGHRALHVIVHLTVPLALLAAASALSGLIY